MIYLTLRPSMRVFVIAGRVSVQRRRSLTCGRALPNRERALDYEELSKSLADPNQIGERDGLFSHQ